MLFEAPRGHDTVLAGLFRAAERRRLSHALLFAGPAGVGKYLSARWLAAGLLCAKGPGPPCSECGPCKRIAVGTHADLLEVDPEADGEEEIKIGRIVYRERDGRANVGDFLSLRAMEGGWRVVLVREADRMNDEAQNALLKTLEEPGGSTLLVLVSSRPESLLPTTRSRCVPVAFAPLDLGLTAAILREKGVEPAAAERLARWSGGAPGTAIALRDRGAPAMRAQIEGVLGARLDALAAAQAIGEIEGEFPGATPTARARARARTCLDLVLAVLGDVARARAGLEPERLAHGDLARDLLAQGAIEASGSAPFRAGRSAGGAGRAAGGAAALERQLEVCFLARQDVEANLAPEVLLERALLALEPRRRPASTRSSDGHARSTSRTAVPGGRRARNAP